MNVISVKSGDNLIHRGEEVNRLFLVLKGEIIQNNGGLITTLGPGTIAGLSDSFNDVYYSEYNVSKDSSLVSFSYKNSDSFSDIFKENSDYIFGFAKGAFRQCRDSFSVLDNKTKIAHSIFHNAKEIYEQYKKIADSYGVIARTFDDVEMMEPFSTDDVIEKWEKDYIECLNSVDNSEIEIIYGRREEVVIGIIGTCCGYIRRAAVIVEEINLFVEQYENVILDSSGVDLLGLLFELRIFGAQENKDTSKLDELCNNMYSFVRTINLFDDAFVKSRFDEYNNHDYEGERIAFEQERKRESEQFEDVLGHVCKFADYSPDKREEFREHIEEFLRLPDKESKDDKARKIRKVVIEDFYQIYEKAYFKSISNNNISPIMKMFFNFGIIDAKVFDDTAIRKLMNLADRVDKLNHGNVYTIFEWLNKIYIGEKEPSKNELDMDYRGFVLEEKKNGNIKGSEVDSWMSNQEEKVRFEIHNFFKSANRTTSGKMTSFCPILLGDELDVEVEKMLVEAEKINRALSKVEDVDYSIFYREAYFTDMRAGINSAPYPVRIPPDFILLPNVGTRAMMWQECAGVKMDTPSRYVFPIFTYENVDKLMIHCCGAFRWEICRREQGSKWNDIGSRCLTSDFYDFFTFYKKNKDINSDNKEKIKNLLKSNRNNMREAFSKQYSIWVEYESKGSVRLLKQERELFMKHCPFAKKYREPLQENPMFEQYISRFNVKNAQAKHHIEAVFDKYKKSGGEISDDVEKGIEYYSL